MGQRDGVRRRATWRRVVVAPLARRASFCTILIRQILHGLLALILTQLRLVTIAIAFERSAAHQIADLQFYGTVYAYGTICIVVVVVRQGQRRARLQARRIAFGSIVRRSQMFCIAGRTVRVQVQKKMIQLIWLMIDARQRRQIFIAV